MKKSKRAITPEDLTKIEVLSEPQFTKDGTSYTFVSTKINENNEYEANIHLQQLHEEKSTPWTYGKYNNSNLSFSPDGRQVVFQSNRSGTPQLWIMHTNGGEARQLTTFKHGASNPHWSPDGKYIIFTASLHEDDDVASQKELSKEEKQQLTEAKSQEPLVVSTLKYKSDAEGFHDDKKTQLVSYSLEGNTFTQLTKGDYHHLFQDISPNGKQILFTANLSDNADYELTNDLYLLDLHSNEIKKLNERSGYHQRAVFSPSGEKIACLGHEYDYAGATLTELYIFDLQSGERLCISNEWDLQLGDYIIGDMRLGASENGPVWSKDGEKIFFIATDRGSTGLYQVDLESNLEILHKNDSHVFGFSYHKETDKFIIGISSPTNPGDFYLFERGSELRQLTTTNKEFLQEVFIATPEELEVTTEDDWKIQGWLLKPYGFEEGKKYPFVLEIHGGPHMSYGQSFFHEMQLLAAKGYVVLYTNPRGSHGYGQEFVNACRSDYGGKDYEDLMAAVDYALDNYSFIDEDRLGVTGGSYGGFMTNWIVGHTNRFKAAVTQRSISNWLSFYGVSDIGYFFTKWELGHNLMEDPKKLWDFSPLKYAENIETPLLILHGEKDFRCPIEQGEQLFITLKHLRKEVEFVRFPDANHELSRSGNPKLRIARLEHICRWFEKYL
ncbi:S9 family peptidase [Oceanobacillus luteolus]|uniref:S9 family peptidase n=1 Tax=Oceanobacillus luteolus TaxID=1274358 RepID=A0ABW4HS03_9BACI|nr:S9 family peptidase [Oceanobacillus luteolus]MCM3739619.1 S9 family peptidase [Oceanobacillus luteolus]